MISHANKPFKFTRSGFTTHGSPLSQALESVMGR